MNREKGLLFLFVLLHVLLIHASANISVKKFSAELRIIDGQARVYLQEEITNYNESLSFTVQGYKDFIAVITPSAKVYKDQGLLYVLPKSVGVTLYPGKIEIL